MNSTGPMISERAARLLADPRTKAKMKLLNICQDQKHRAMVDALIPMASKMADADLKDSGLQRYEARVGNAVWCNWTVFFHQRMNQFKREQELIK